MAEAVVSFAVERFGDWLSHEANFLYEVSDRVEELQKELKRMQSFLKDADARQAESASVRNWVAEIKEIAYDAEDLIETFVLKVASRRGRGIKNVLQRFAFFLNKAKRLHNVGSEIGSITRRISRIAMSFQAYGIKELRDREGASSSYEAQREKRQSFPHVVQSNLVGLEQNTKELVTNLVAGEKQFRAISVCGMGGLGKTTLAKQVYHHIQVRRHFDRFAWAYVSQQCQRRDVWQGILLDLTSKGDRKRIIELRDKELAEELHRCMTDNKCLVILDDIWSVEAWDRLKNAFPEDETGSKILLTSRNKEVASHADPGGFIQEPQCLKDAESWELLQKIAFSRRDAAEFRIDERMEEIGKQMVKHCAGLPLAIKVLGGLLATRYTSNQWQTIHENIKTYITRGNLYGQNHSAISDVLSLSYDDLLPQLKQCFLYLSLFPEDYEIEVRKLTKFWVAEGMVTSVKYKGEGEDEDENGMVDDVAECYLDELIERSMVLVGRRDYTGLKIKTCRMHDLMRDLCLLKAEEESFLKVINPQLQDHRSDVFSSWPTGNFRRLAVHMRDGDIFRQKLPRSRLRSLLFITEKFERFSWQPTFKNLKLLRVLDLERVQFDGLGDLPKDIGRLIHLRFLSLRNAWVLKLPSTLGNLKLLQTLVLFIDNTVHVPNVIWKMERLRHLYLPWKCDDRTKLKLGTLRNLRTLVNFHLENCEVNDLFNMTNLRRLEIIYKTKDSLKEIIDASLSVALKRLQSLSFWLESHDTDMLQPPVDVSPLVSGLINLSSMDIAMKIEKLTKFPPHITSIYLSLCNLAEDPMPILEKLPNLRFLLFDNAFMGREMVCSRQGFRKLHFLRLARLQNLEEWNVDEGALPNLCRLFISNCLKLKALPDGMITLQELEINWMPKTFKDKLVQGGEHFYKVQHVPSVTFHVCDEELIFNIS